jgi:hypothetical protein
MVRLHGEGVDWRNVDINPMALYARGGGGAMDDEPMILL